MLQRLCHLLSCEIHYFVPTDKLNTSLTLTPPPPTPPPLGSYWVPLQAQYSKVTTQGVKR